MRVVLIWGNLSRLMQPNDITDSLMADNILPFPLPHRGDPEPRRMALASIGFRWQAGMWRRGRVVLSDSDIDVMDVRTWEQSLRRWAKRRPRPRQ